MTLSFWFSCLHWGNHRQVPHHCCLYKMPGIEPQLPSVRGSGYPCHLSYVSTLRVTFTMYLWTRSSSSTDLEIWVMLHYELRHSLQHFWRKQNGKLETYSKCVLVGNLFTVKGGDHWFSRKTWDVRKQNAAKVIVTSRRLDRDISAVASSIDILDRINMGMGPYPLQCTILAFFVFYLTSVITAKSVPRFCQMPPRREELILVEKWTNRLGI